MFRVILTFSTLVLAGGLVMSAATVDQVIFDFGHQQDLDLWITINDTVMGGISQSTMQSGKDNTALFAGSVSLEKYGGFCSVASKPAKAWDLSAYKGIALRVKGDGKRYKVTLKSDATFTGFSYQYPFETVKDQWLTIHAPFDMFKPYFRGALQTDIGAIDRSRITSFGLLISDKQAGPFRLEIREIRAYSINP